ncbi:hypothetical protein B0H14DRAFT_2987162 [Mycena olivaceomarginata]|nr:hypothetical protein B0H14DRAFT_2987162 [Mycena olivaceomarginata]
MPRQFACGAVCLLCVPTSLLPPQHNHDIDAPNTTNYDCEGWGELDADFGRMWWFGGAEQAGRYVRRVQPFHCQYHPRPSFTGKLPV